MKKADVDVARVLIEQSLKMVAVAEAEVKAAAAHVAEARAALEKFQAETDRWDTEVKRLTAEVARGVVSPQILLESTNQFKSSTAARGAARATIVRALADQLPREADAAKAKIDVPVPPARLVGPETDAK